MAVLGVLSELTSARNFGPWSIAATQIWAWAVTGGCAVVATILGGRTAFGWGGTEIDRAVARWGGRRLQVTSLPPALLTTSVETPDDLMQIADRTASPILHVAGGSRHEFAVLHQGTRYTLALTTEASPHDASLVIDLTASAATVPAQLTVV